MHVSPTSSLIATNISNVCVFRKIEEDISFCLGEFKFSLSLFINSDFKCLLKDNYAVEIIDNLGLFVLHCKFFIHKNIFLNTLPGFEVFPAEMSHTVKSLKLWFYLLSYWDFLHSAICKYSNIVFPFLQFTIQCWLDFAINKRVYLIQYRIELIRDRNWVESWNLCQCPALMVFISIFKCFRSMK